MDALEIALNVAGLLLLGLIIAGGVSVLIYYAYARSYVRHLQVCGVYEVDSTAKICLIEVRDAQNRHWKYLGSGVRWHHYPGGDTAGSLISIERIILHRWLDKQYLEFYYHRHLDTCDVQQRQAALKLERERHKNDSI